MPARPQRLHFKIPGKTFLVGEYVSMFGGPSLLAATLPTFEITFNGPIENTSSLANSNFEQIHSAFNENSPAGKWLSLKNSEFTDVNITFHDPYKGKGGFGASTAQFLSSYLYLFMKHNISTDAFKEPSFIFECWQNYLNLFSEDLLKPSGADLVSQIVGDICVFHANEHKLTSQKWPFENLDVLFLKTPHKVATHEHLKTLNKADLPLVQLEKVALRTIESLVVADQDGFLFAIKEYGELLAEANLLCKESEQLITELSPIRGVKYIKGCGALGADVLALFVDKSESESIQKNLSHYEFVVSLQENLSPGVSIEVLT